MKNSRTALFCFLGLSLWYSALPPRLEAGIFPDLVKRYKVGDPNAHNPLRQTEGPKTVITCDLNEDGLPDVVLGNLDGSISVLLGDAQGQIGEQILIPATGLLEKNNIRALAAGDFNGDGHPDVAAADIAFGSVVILQGFGDGRLLPINRAPVGPARALAAGDFDEDGKMDLVVGCGPPDCDVSDCLSPYRSLKVLYGAGDFTFSAAPELLGPDSQACFYDVAAVDLNRDGHIDILALDYTTTNCTPSGAHKQIFVFRNLGQRNFLQEQTLQVAGEGPRAFTVAYLDEEVHGSNVPAGATLDVLVANRDSSTIDLFFQTGDFVFAPPVSIGAGDTPRDVVVGDLNGDGWADLVVVNRNWDTISVLQGIEAGLFSIPQVEMPTGNSPRQAVLADFNGDGALDAAVNNRVSEDVSIFWGTNQLTGFLFPEGYYPTGFSPVGLVSGDFDEDEDGWPDVAIANFRSHDVRVRCNQGQGKLGRETIYPVNFQPFSLAAADLNGDSHIDLVVGCLGDGTANYPPTILTLTNRGDGFFTNAFSLIATNFRPYSLHVGNLSTDAVPDLVIGGLRGELFVCQGRGNGSFEPPMNIGLPANGYPMGVALGDFDNDKQLDIACVRGLVFLNRGHFFEETNWNERGEIIQYSCDSYTQPLAIESADLDGDENLDLLVTLPAEDKVAILFGNGTNSFVHTESYSFPLAEPSALVACDFDGDGMMDIAVGQRRAASVAILKGVGGRQFELVETPTTYRVENLLAVDLNNDSQSDLVGVGTGLWTLINGAPAAVLTPQPESPIRNPPPGRDSLFINEIMSWNQNTLMACHGTPDWIELYNPRPFSQNLAGWSLELQTTRTTNRWTVPPGISIGPKGYLLIFCDAKKNCTEGGGITATFELSADRGGTLVLYNAGNAEMDYVKFPAMPRPDISYARYPDGSDPFIKTGAPTPRFPNVPANLSPMVQRAGPYVGAGGSGFGVVASIIDDAGIAYATVYWQKKGDTNVYELGMRDDGQSGDRNANDQYFGAFLPALAPNTTVEFWFRAVDLEGKDAFDPGDETTRFSLQTPQPSQNIRLNELVAANQTGLTNQWGDFPDWIEVVNTASEPVSLNGLGLTQNPWATNDLWCFHPNITLQPNQHKLVYCEGSNNPPAWQANFKLNREGDNVYLVQTNGWIILDGLSFGAQPDDTSFGVLNHGTNAQMLPWPTPMAPNLGFASEEAGVRIYPRLLHPPWEATNAFGLRFLNPSGGAKLLSSEDLQSWNTNAPVDLGAGLFQWLEPGYTNGHRFYRLLLGP